MACRTINLPGGGTMIVCGERRREPRTCKACGEPIAGAVLLCDWKLTGAAAGRTCDAPLCARCATAVAEDKHLCPPHARAWAKHPRNPAAAG